MGLQEPVVRADVGAAPDLLEEAILFIGTQGADSPHLGGKRF
jgi:hypothetical protein